MILTKKAIKQAHENGEIIIEPFEHSQLNPNSYNFRLGQEILIAKKSVDLDYKFEKHIIPNCGFVLKPKTLYLASTLEVIGSKKYVTTLLGRSSLGRLGLFLNITADLGHVGTVSQWTLELKVVQPLKVYPHMRIGQIAFWVSSSSNDNYCGRYNWDTGPVQNRDLMFGLKGIF